MASQDFKSDEAKIKNSLITLTRTVQQLTAEDLSFYRTADADVGDALDDANERIFSLASDLLKSAVQNTNLKPLKLEDADDIDVRWGSIVDVVDSVLEKADTALDEYTGLVKRKESLAAAADKRQQSTAYATAGASTTGRAATSGKSSMLSFNLRFANVPKPQLKFEHPPDNYVSPWKPILTAKPHAKVLLEDSIKLQQESSRYNHPYQTEIEAYDYPTFVRTRREPTLYHPVETTVATWVDTYEGVLAMLEELKQAKEIAVDLEHHEYRSYIGLASLMQISTREKDWIVDTLKPWRHRLEVLNEVLADPNIVKVFHGSYMDILWLQRDFGLYVVGLFDTGAACEALRFPAKGLAYVLQRFVNFEADKRYQLADWRLRPLTTEMLYYARSDTHYLLYVYDLLCNQLLNQKYPGTNEPCIDFVLRRSKELALRVYHGLDYGADGRGNVGWFEHLRKMQDVNSMTDQQFSVFRAVHKWRDEVGRRQDEGVNFVLPLHILNDIAHLVPTDVKAIHSLLRSSAPGAKSRVEELVGVIKGASTPPFAMSFHDILSIEAPGHREEEAASSTPSRILSAEVFCSTQSQMFGDVPVSSLWETSEPSRNVDNAPEDIPVPWAKYVEGAMLEETLGASNPDVEMADDSDTAPEVPAEHQEEEEEEVEEQFTLKAGRKRKAEEALEEDAAHDCSSEADTESESESESEDEGETDGVTQKEAPKKVQRQDSVDGAVQEEFYALDDSDDEKESRVKKRSKKNKKQSNKKKKQKREMPRQLAGLADVLPGAGPGKKKKKNKNSKKRRQAKEPKMAKADPTDYEVFDYSKAESVIKSNPAEERQQDGPKKKGRGVQKVFNKNLQGDIKPARGKNYKRPGKTQTFK